MGNYLPASPPSRYQLAYDAYYAKPDTTPKHDELPTFDPMYGFPNGRQEREMIATQEEMEAMNVPSKFRDFCAHKYIEYMHCRNQQWPFAARCKHERHDWDLCEVEDYEIRMKEFERERRLRERAARKSLAARKTQFAEAL